MSVVLYVLRKTFAVLNCLWSNGILDFIISLIINLAQAFLLFLSGNNISAQRAFFMNFFRSILEKWFGRGHNLFFWWLAFIIMLSFNPFSVFSLSFQMSFLSTFALLTAPGYGKWVFANLLLSPIVLHKYGFINLLSFLANIIAVPFFSHLVLPMTIIALIIPSTSLVADFLWEILVQFLFLMNKYGFFYRKSLTDYECIAILLVLLGFLLSFAYSRRNKIKYYITNNEDFI